MDDALAKWAQEVIDDRHNEDEFRAFAIAVMAEERCGWRESRGMELDLWETRCGRTFCFEAGGPIENDYKYCPGCGHQVLVHHEERPTQ